MIHLRIVAPEEAAHKALEILHSSPAVLNVVHLHGAAKKPDGDLILCDVAREEASVIIGDLKELDIPRVGSIAVEHIDTALSDAADRRREGRRPACRPTRSSGRRSSSAPARTRSCRSASWRSWSLAMQIAAVGILLDQPILIVGAMVVGPEFGPLAGLSVALVERRSDFARRSLTALAVGLSRRHRARLRWPR